MLDQYYVLTDVLNNNNKFWHVKQEGSRVSSEWGRVGDSAQTTVWDLASEYKAESFAQSKIRGKIKKGYELVDNAHVTNSSGNFPANVSGSVKEIALREIDCDGEETRKLVEWLTDQNIHHILDNTSAKYNYETGVFTTPLGIVISQKSIDKARGLLANILSLVEKNDWANPNFAVWSNSYFKTVPTNLGRAAKKIDCKDIFSSRDKVTKHADILDALQASLKVEPVLVEGETRKVFDCKVHLEQDKAIVSEIETLFKSTLQTMHYSSRYTLQKVYKIALSAEQERWQKKQSELSNIKRLWHGSKPANVLSILKSGLGIPPANSSYVTGRMWSDGIYFSDISSKSLNYSCGGTWSSDTHRRCFMFLANVALGKSYIPKGTHDGPFPKPGYDSVFAQSGKSGVMNNEFIVYQTDRVNLQYLVEFSY